MGKEEMDHIAFEDIDNAGKPTHAKVLLNYLCKKGVLAELTA